MDIDFHSQAVHLLERIANSIHDRDATNTTCFSSSEVQVVEEWLKEFLDVHVK